MEGPRRLLLGRGVLECVRDSRFPALHSTAVEMSIGVVGIITLLNLRGLRESATIFAIPTYAFMVAMVLLLIGGFARLAFDPGLKATPPESLTPLGSSGLTLFIV